MYRLTRVLQGKILNPILKKAFKPQTYAGSSLLYKPKRFYQNPNIVDLHQIDVNDFNEMMGYLENCLSTEEIAAGFKANLDILTDNLLHQGLNTMVQLQLDCDQVFYDEIVPI